MFWSFFSANAFYKTLEGPIFDSHLTHNSNKNCMLKRYSSDSSFIGENVGSKGYNDFSVTNDWTIFYQGHRTSGPWLKLEAKKQML